MINSLILALKIIKEFEGCALVSYQDIGGVWTIGWGSTKNVTPSMSISQDEADQRSVDDLKETATSVENEITAPLNENQLAALLSFTFNEGSGHLDQSTLRLKLNTGDFSGAADAFLLWDKVRGCVVPGLLRRRQMERELFLKPVS